MEAPAMLAPIAGELARSEIQGRRTVGLKGVLNRPSNVPASRRALAQARYRLSLRNRMSISRVT